MTNKLHKLFKPGLIFIGLVACYALLGMVVLPLIVKAKLPQILQQSYSSSASLAKIQFNPFNGRVGITDFELKDPHNQPLLSFAELQVDLDVLGSLLAQRLELAEVHFGQPRVNLIALAEGGYNFSSFSSSETPSEPQDEKTFPLLIKAIDLTDGSLTWSDQHVSDAKSITLNAINISLQNLSTEANAKSQLNLVSQLPEGGKLIWQADLSLAPFYTNGRIQLEKLSILQLWTLFLKDQVNFKLAQGEAGIELNYQLNSSDDQFQMQFNQSTLTLHQLQLTGREDQQAAISIPELAVKDIAFDWVAQTLKVGTFETQGLNLKTVIDQKGQLNLERLFAGKAAPTTHVTPPATLAQANVAPTKPWLLTIAKTVFNKLTTEYTDPTGQSVANAQLAELNIALDELALDYRSEQLKLDIQKSAIGARKLKLEKPLETKLVRPLAMNLGELQFTMGRYQFDSSADKLAMTAKDAGLKFVDFAFNEVNAKQTLVTIPEFSIKGASLDLAKQQIQINLVHSSKARLNAWLDKQGRLNYQQLFKTEGDRALIKPEDIKTVKAVAKPWQILLNELKFEDYALDFKDLSQQEAVDFELAPLMVQVQNINSQKLTQMPINLQTKINKTGTLNLKGQVGLEPINAQLQLALQNLQLNTFQEYLDDFLRVDIIDGGLDTTANIKLSQAANANLQMQVQGNSGIKALIVRDQIMNKDLIKWQLFKLDGITFDLADMGLKVDKMLIKEPYGRLTIKEDRSLNFDDIVVKHSPPQKASQVKEKEKEKEKKEKLEPKVKMPEPHYSIGEVTVDGGSSDFADFSLILPFVVQLNDLNGAIKTISSEQNKLTNFALAGKVFDLSPMDIKGKFNADLSSLDIGMHFKGMSLPFISPYMVEFAGYKIEKGKMSVDLLYKVDNKKLTAENNFVLDQLTLGERVENPKATTLPMKLAVSLLKDREGKIKINMPISGSLDDPNFSVIPILWDTFMNMLTRAVASPFTILGSLVDSDADFSEIDFPEGDAKLSSGETGKLADLAKALLKKPELNIDVKGRAFEKQDWPAMQDDALVDQLKAIKAEALRKQGKRQAVEHVQLSDSDNDQLLADLFIQKFPHLAKRSVLGTPELINSKADFYSVARQQLAAMIPPNQFKLRDLASARARSVAQYLTQKAGIDPNRLFILDVDLDSSTQTTKPNVQLALRVQ